MPATKVMISSPRFQLCHWFIVQLSRNHSASLCWTHFICKIETQLFFSLEISLLLQLTIWALITAQRREQDRLLKQHRLSSAQGNCETAPSGLEKEMRFLQKYLLHQPLTYWECAQVGTSSFPHPRNKLRLNSQLLHFGLKKIEKLITHNKNATLKQVSALTFAHSSKHNPVPYWRLSLSLCHTHVTSFPSRWIVSKVWSLKLHICTTTSNTLIL